jgi:hypothetical protein
MNLIRFSCDSIDSFSRYLNVTTLFDDDVWVNGRLNGKGGWRTQPGNIPVNSDLYISEGPKPGYCLSIAKNGKGFEALSADCESRKKAFCEFRAKRPGYGRG